jgi:aldehyde dehydrogenase (NAD+)
MGGGIPDLAQEFSEGYFVEPTIFAGVAPQSPLGQEEIFGPVYSIMTFSDPEEAISLANATRFGLSAYIHTADLKLAHRVAAGVRAGTVYVNDANRRNTEAPFGGYGSSGLGREGGRAGLDEFLRMKTVGIA